MWQIHMLFVTLFLMFCFQTVWLRLSGACPNFCDCLPVFCKIGSTKKSSVTSLNIIAKRTWLAIPALWCKALLISRDLISYEFEWPWKNIQAAFYVPKWHSLSLLVSYYIQYFEFLSSGWCNQWPYNKKAKIN